MTRPLTDDQRLLQDSAREFFAERSPVKALRADRAAGRPFDPALWQEIAALGFAGAAVPEAYGGSGMGWRSLGLVLEAAGRTLVASPLLRTRQTAERVAHAFPANGHNENYLRTKAERSGHLL